MTEFPLVAERIRRLDIQAEALRARYESGRNINDRVSADETEKERDELIEVLRLAKRNNDLNQILLWSAIGMSLLMSLSVLFVIAWIALR